MRGMIPGLGKATRESFEQTFCVYSQLALLWGARRGLRFRSVCIVFIPFLFFLLLHLHSEVFTCLQIMNSCPFWFIPVSALHCFSRIVPVLACSSFPLSCFQETSYKELLGGTLVSEATEVAVPHGFPSGPRTIEGWARPSIRAFSLIGERFIDPWLSLMMLHHHSTYLFPRFKHRYTFFYAVQKTKTKILLKHFL